MSAGGKYAGYRPSMRPNLPGSPSFGRCTGNRKREVLIASNPTQFAAIPGVGFESHPKESNLFSEYLTLNLLSTMIQSSRAYAFARGGGTSMEFESNRTKQLMSLLLTVAVVGGAMFYAFNAA